MNIKDDMIPFINNNLLDKESEFMKKQFEFSTAKKENETRTTRMLMEKKVRLLSNSENNCRKAHATLKPKSK